MKILVYLLARLSEPSSYAGIGALLALLGFQASDPMLSDLAQLLAAVCGLLGLFLKERGLLAAIMIVSAIGPALSGLACLGGDRA